MNDRILFVDDDASLLAAYVRMLRTHFHVDSALNGRDGLLRLAEVGDCGYAVVVSDLHMPGMSGVDFLAQVRALCPKATRIMLSGDIGVDTEADDESFHRLTKPCRWDALVAAIQAGVLQFHRTDAMLTAPRRDR